MSSNLQPGCIISYIGQNTGSLPSKWLYCDGASYGNMQYPETVCCNRRSF
ncbi:hypothetical protein F1609_29305 [Massilia sp. CCM 8693]|uniref:Tail fiber protein n=1 Tax=Massilia aquatica TaxID=2609000 RepID=A0ABX0MAN9_9BURK|nr:hypothetical protein [Massilia aquatica]